MAEIVDIIHRLSYEADTDVIETVNAEFGTQLKQLEALRAKEAQYAQQLEKTSKDNIGQQKVLQGLLVKTKREYENVVLSISKQVGENKKLEDSLVRVSRNAQGLTRSFTQLLREGPAFAFSAQTGILALSNNIPIFLDQIKAAQAEGKSTTDIFTDLGTELFSVTGLLTLGVTALSIFGDELFAAGESAEDADKKFKGLTGSLDDYLKHIDSINKIKGSSIFGETFDFGATTEADLQRELELMRARGDSAANVALQEQKISKARQTALELQRDDLKAALDYVKALRDSEKRSATDESLAVPALSKAFLDIINSGQDPLKIAGELTQRLNAINNEILNEENKRGVVIAERQVQLRDEEKKLREIRDRIKEIAQETFKIDDLTKFTEGIADEITKNVNSLEKVADILDKNIGGQTPGFIQGQPSGRTDLKTPQQLSEEARQRKEDAKNLEDDKTARKKAIDDTIQYSYQAVQTTLSTFQQIYDAQANLLDREISLRRERVAQAIELAEKGNTEILAIEQERLRKTEEEREKVAQKQLQTNALLQASSAAIAATQAIQTVTNAGATGDPYTAAPRIAAAVAALAAGFAFVTNLTQAFKFADGVIDLNGPGTERSDSIPARLSRGESVMTAAETREFKPYLEAMRDGNFYNMIANMAQPVFVQGQSYGKLEKKLDGVIAAVEGIHISANQKMDKNGISQAIESYKRQEGNRWR